MSAIISLLTGALVIALIIIIVAAISIIFILPFIGIFLLVGSLMETP
jgi:hypothetical protein